MMKSLKISHEKGVKRSYEKFLFLPQVITYT